MHAFFRLAGYRDLPADVEEGTCQLMALLWLEHQTPVEVCGVGVFEGGLCVGCVKTIEEGCVRLYVYACVFVR